MSKLKFVPKPLCCDVVEAFSSEERMKLLMTTIGLGGCAAASVLEKFTGLDTSIVRENLEILERTGFVEVRDVGKTTVVVRLQKINPPIAVKTTKRKFLPSFCPPLLARSDDNVSSLRMPYNYN